MQGRLFWLATALLFGVLLHQHANVVAPADLWMVVIATLAVGPLLGTRDSVNWVSLSGIERVVNASLFVVGPIVVALTVPSAAPVAVAVATAGALGIALAFRERASAPTLLSRIRRRLSAGWLCAASLAAVTGVVYAGVWMAEPYLQRATLGLPLQSLTGRLLGVTVTGHATGAAITTAGRETVVALGPRGGDLLPCALLLAVGFVSITGAARTKWVGIRSMLVLVGLVLAYREVLIVVRSVRIADGTAMANPIAWAQRYAVEWSILPLAIALVPLPARAPPIVMTGGARVNRLALAAAFVGGVILGFGFGWWDAGTPKRGRICFDDSHGDWEWMNVPLDKRLFGPKTTYNYWSFRILLEQYYPTVDVHADGELTAELLGKYDVWVLKTPTRPYSTQEVDAVRTYVESGGGVWLIGDHTNIFGMNTYLNQIAESFDIRYNTDALTPISSAEVRRDRWQRQSCYSHPITTTLPSFFWATSCSITPLSPRVSPVLIADRVYSDAPDYSINTFFGNFVESSDERRGRFISCAAVQAGRGRIVAFTDSTVFSSFFMHLPGKPELALGSIEWLNRENGTPWPRRLAIGIGLVLCAMSLVAAGPSVRIAAVVAALVGASLASRTADEFTGRLRVPEPRWTLPRIGFLVYDSTALPIDTTTAHDEQSSAVYQTLFVWTQRDGFLPDVVWDWDAASQREGVVCIDPPVPNSYEAERMRAYLRQGGHVFVLTPSDIVLRRLLAIAGSPPDVTVQRVSAKARRMESLAAQGVQPVVWKVMDGRRSASSQELPIGTGAWAIRGGRSIVTMAGGVNAVTVIEVGAGTLTLCTLPETYSNKMMGGTTQIPTSDRVVLFDTLWDVLAGWKSTMKSPGATK